MAAVLFILSLGAFVISARSFKQKGFLFNNAYLYASKQERETMDKSKHYRQSAIIFLLAGIVFLLSAAAELFGAGWLYYLVTGIVILAIIYAVFSSIRIETRRKDV